MDLEDRLSRVEARLSRIEVRLHLSAAPASRLDVEAPRVLQTPAPSDATPPLALAPTVAAPATPAAPPCYPVTPRPHRPLPHRSPSKAPAEGADWERVLGVAVLGRVGIGALLLAAVYFAQLAWTDLSPTLRVLSIYGLSGALVVAGFLLRPRVAQKYIAILWGGGVAAAYLAGTVARLRYGIVDPVPATVLLVVACALGQFLARTIRLPALAHVALVGAIAAPILVGGPHDARTSLLVYLLVVHAWAAFTEGRWGWHGARWIAAIGATVAGCLWVSTHGQADLSTTLHLQGYLFGLTWPEWSGIVRGRSFNRWHLLVVLGLAMVGEVLASSPAFGRESLRLAPMLAGAAWLGLAALARLRGVAADRGVAWLARVGSVVLIVGAMAAWAHMGTSWLSTEQGVTVTLAVLGTAFVLARPFFGSGDGTATLAAAVGLLWASGLSPRDPWIWAGMAAPLALALRGGHAWSRIAGLLLAAVAPFVGVGDTLDPTLRALAYAGAAAAAVLAHLRADRGRDPSLAAAAEGVLSLLVVALMVEATTGVLAPVTRAFMNPGTAVALTLAAALAWVGRPGTGQSRAPAWIARGAFVVLLVFAGWREVAHLARPIADVSLRAMVHVGYVAMAASVLLSIGRARSALLAVGGGWVLLGVAVLLAVNASIVPGAGWAAAGMLWLVLTPAVTMLRRRDGGSPIEAGIASAFVIGAAALWTLFLARGWWADEVLLTNPRLVAGLATAAALVLARRTKALADFEESTRALAWAAAGLGFVVGLFEVHEAVTTFASTPWRSPLVSVYATLYAAGLLAVGFRTGARHLRMLALLAFAGVVAKVGLHDLAAVETPYRILITACLGVVLLLAAYAYARRERRLPPHPGAQAERIEEAA